MKNKLFLIILSAALLFATGCSKSNTLEPTATLSSKKPVSTADPSVVKTFENFIYYIQDETIVIKGYDGDPEPS